MTINSYALKPTKAKELVPETAKVTNSSEQLVEDVIDFYWREVRKSLGALQNSRVHITNLGDFTIKHWKLSDKIEMLEKWEENNRQKGMQQMTARFKTAEILFDLKNMQKILEEESQRKDFIKLHKTRTDESKGKHISDMEEQGPDSGGDKE